MYIPTKNCSSQTVQAIPYGHENSRKIKILLESSPPKSGILVGRLAVQVAPGILIEATAVWKSIGGTQTGSYQTGSYQKGRFIPPKPKLLYFVFCWAKHRSTQQLPIHISGAGLPPDLQIWLLGTTPLDTTPFICL